MAEPKWVENLKRRWKITSNWDFAIIFTVFALTGSLTAASKRWFFAWVGISLDNTPLALFILYYILYLLLAYQPILLLLGTLAGKFSFFWAFVKRFSLWLMNPFKKRKPRD